MSVSVNSLKYCDFEIVNFSKLKVEFKSLNEELASFIGTLEKLDVKDSNVEDGLNTLLTIVPSSILNSPTLDLEISGTTPSNWWPQWGRPAQRKLATPTQNHSPDVSFINGIRPIGSSFREDWSSPHCA